MAQKGNPLAQTLGAVIMALGGVLAFVALVRLFDDVEFIRQLIFRFQALGIGSLWVMAVILFAAGYYVFRAD